MVSSVDSRVITRLTLADVALLLAAIDNVSLVLPADTSLAVRGVEMVTVLLATPYTAVTTFKDT